MNELSGIIGLKIRQKRQENGINQEKLALLAEIDRSYMGRIERGEVNITLENSTAYAKYWNAKRLICYHYVPNWQSENGFSACL